MFDNATHSRAAPRGAAGTYRAAGAAAHSRPARDARGARPVNAKCSLYSVFCINSQIEIEAGQAQITRSIRIVPRLPNFQWH